MKMISKTKNSSQLLEKYYRIFFSVFMALYPILCIYKGISRFTIGDVILIVFFLIAFLKQKSFSLDFRSFFIVAFIIYALIMLVTNLLFLNLSAEHEPTALFIRLIKFIFYMVCATTLGSKAILPRVFKKTLYFMGVLACLFLILQYFMFYAYGSVIRGIIPWLPLHIEQYSMLDYELIYGYFFRPSSFFLEPSLFTHYTIVPLVFALFDNTSNKKNRKIFLVVILTVGIIMSTAAQGLVYLAVAFIFYFIFSKNKKQKLLLLSLTLCGIIILFFSTDIIQTAFERLLFDEEAADARLGSYLYCLKMSPLHMWLGHGYGATANNSFMAGAAYVWYGCGIIGLMLVLGIFAVLYKKANNTVSKNLCLIFFIMFGATGLFYNYMVFWYFSLILANNYTKRRQHC